ncbi:hypothetical protein E4U09_002998 [Claviceps aff. purpurea]|uniref:Uncharacterized protein n=1 Tax=Claviceps aff. purpurea TaxID=1967640 RepID=A0A9P7U2D8_9HYPO|nr:hypothetical protein E4U09_002998 [Claviceps aff. purpurea]
MGKPSASPPKGSSSAPAASLAMPPPLSSDRQPREPSHARYFDQDVAELGGDDLPPLYTEHEDFNDDPRPYDPLLPPSRDNDGFETVYPFRRDETTAYYLDARLDRDPDFLAHHIDKLAMIPPRPFVRIVGTHTDKAGGGSCNDKNQNRDTQEVTDFEIEIELTHLFYSDIRSAQAWNTLHTAGNFEKVRRGTVLATRAPGFGGSGGALPEEGVPGLREWCRRYCASRCGLKCFTMERRVEGYDWEMLRRRLHGLVQATNYRGHVNVDFPVRHSHVHVYNECRINRWRLTKWIATMFTLSLMFVFTWPYLFFMTRRWETVTAEWRLSEPTAVPGRRKYVSMSEEQWYTMWAAATQRAMLERRRGILDQGDLERARMGLGRGQGQGERGERMMRTVEEGVEAMGVVNRSFGWGGDSC